MNLGAKNAKSARMYEAATVYAKYYTLDNLPEEEELISDFKEILKLFDLLVYDRDILKIIETPVDIKEAEYKFRDILYHKADEIIDEIHWSNDLGIGFRYIENDYNRYFNGFGIEKPNSNIKMSVFCEINIEKDGSNKNTAGAFAKDLQGNLYVIHRGNIAGINRTEFFDKYTGETTQIQDGNTKTNAVIISNLNDPKLPENIRNFVVEVQKIKNLSYSNKLDINLFLSKILRSYKGIRAKNEKVGGHPLSNVFNEFARNLKEFVNSKDFLEKTIRYNTKSSTLVIINLLVILIYT